MIFKNKLMFSLFLLSSLLFVPFSFSQIKTDSSAAAPKKIFTIENCVNEFNIEKSEKTKAGYQYWFADKEFAEGRTVKMSVVGPFLEVHPPKANPVDEFIFVLEGKGEFYLDGKTKVVGPMTCCFYPANVVCGIKNLGEKELKYLVIKAFEKNK